MRWLKKFFHQYPRYILLFVTAFTLPLLINLISSYLEQRFGTARQLSWAIAILVAISMLLFVPAWLSIRSQIRRFKFVPGKPPPPPSKGLISLIGPGKADDDVMSRLKENMAYRAVQFHKPTVTWLIPSEKSAKVAQALKELIQEENDIIKVIITDYIDEWETQDSYDRVRKIYHEEAQQNGLLPEEIIADFTGGTKPMSAGMVLACQDSYKMEYWMFDENKQSRLTWVQFKHQKTERTA